MITVAIPTYNNTRQLIDTLISLVRNTDFQGRILVINNGDIGSYEEVQSYVPHEVDWIDAGRNLGWEGGINLALKHADSEFFCMLNDDVLFPPASYDWWKKALGWFDVTNVGGVGPTSNYVSGYQSALVHGVHPILYVPFLIGFCAMYRTSVLRQLGGLDETLPGGDDIDLSIRIKDKGLNLVADRRCYLHHHGAQTGTRLRDDWDSQKHQADTYNALIRKHGLKRWFECANGQAEAVFTMERQDPLVERMQRIRAIADGSLQDRYLRECVSRSDISGHLPMLYMLASTCKHVTEFGVNDGTTTTAFLYAQPEVLESYDVAKYPEVDELAKIAGKTNFIFHHRSTLSADITETDLLFIDDLHDYAHVKRELEQHAHKARKYLAFHDTFLFGNQDETDDKGPGIWKAISEYVREHPEWRLMYHTDEFCGLTVFERR